MDKKYPANQRGRNNAREEKQEKPSHDI